MNQDSSAEQEAPGADTRHDLLFLYPLDAGRETIVLIAMAAVLVVFRSEAFLNLSSSYLGGYERDAGLYIWLVKSNIHDFFSLPWFNTRAFYPYTLTLAWSDNFILPSLVVKALTLPGVPFVAAYNLTLLSASLLNGYFTYLLCYKLLGKYLPAFIAGAAFMTFPFLSSHLGHPQLQFAFWAPAGFLFFFGFVSRRCFSLAFAAGFTVFLAFLCTPHYAILMTLSLLFFFLGFYLLRPHLFRAFDYAKFASGFLTGVFPIVFFLWPYLAVTQEMGSRLLYEAHAFSANALSYFSSTPFNALYGLSSNLSHAEAQLFPGFIVILFAVLAFLRLRETKKLKRISIAFTFFFVFALAFSALGSFWPGKHFVYLTAILLWLSVISFAVLIYRMGQLEQKMGFYIVTHRALMGVFLLAGLLFFAISFGPIGNPEDGEIPLGVHTVFFYAFPGMDSIRAVGRVGIFAVLMLILSASFYLFLVEEKRAKGKLALGLVLIAVMAENYNYKYPLEEEVPGPRILNYFMPPPVSDDVVMILPYTTRLTRDERVKSWGDFARLNTYYKNWMSGREWFLVNGYSGQRSRLMLEYPRKMSGFPDQRSVNSIAYISGLRYIVYLSALVPDFDRADFLRRVEEFSVYIKLIEEDEEGNFLFEYVGMTPIRDTYYIFTPSYPSGFMHLELRTGYYHEVGEVEVELLLPDSLGEEPFTRLELPTTGEWHTYTIRMPATSNRVRPLRLLLRSGEEPPVYVGRRKFSLDAHR